MHKTSFTANYNQFKKNKIKFIIHYFYIIDKYFFVTSYLFAVKN